MYWSSLYWEIQGWQATHVSPLEGDKGCSWRQEPPWNQPVKMLNNPRSAGAGWQESMNATGVARRHDGGGKLRIFFKAPDMEQKGEAHQKQKCCQVWSRTKTMGVLEGGRRTKTSQKGDSQGQAGGFRRGAAMRSRGSLKRKTFTAWRIGAESSEGLQEGRL